MACGSSDTGTRFTSQPLLRTIQKPSDQKFLGVSFGSLHLIMVSESKTTRSGAHSTIDAQYYRQASPWIHRRVCTTLLAGMDEIQNHLGE